MKYDFIVLGADGLQGQIVVKDLLKNGYSVFAADLYRSRIEPLLKRYKNIKTAFTYVDLRDVDMAINVIEKSGADVVINCAEEDWNLNVYNACIQTRTHCIDLGASSKLTKKQMAMDKDFKRIKKTAITGCGAVPGIGNVMLRYAAKKFNSIDTIDIGFAWDSNIKKFVIPFSVKSILSEFTFPVFILQNGRWIRKTPLKTERTKYYKFIGYQRAFLVDHAELFTFYRHFKNKGVKNIRFYAGFPNHSTNVFKTLVDLGFASNKPVKAENTKIVADEYLTQLLKRLKIPRKYKEWENVWVEVTGRQNRKKKIILMECFVPTVKGWEDAVTNIDTGIPASVIAQMIKEGKIKHRGSFAPEGIVPEYPFFKELRKKKMIVYENGKVVN